MQSLKILMYLIQVIETYGIIREEELHNLIEAFTIIVGDKNQSN